MRRMLSCVMVLCVAGGVYCGSFVVMRKRVPVTTFEGIPLYYFSKNETANEWLWLLYWPVHREGEQPVSQSEWMAVQEVRRSFYVRDVSPWKRVLSSG